MSFFKKKESKIEVYTMENCKYCELVKESFTEANIKFKEVPIDKNRDKWEDILKVTNFPQTPTVVFKDNYLCPMRDFSNPEMLKDQLNSLKNDINIDNSILLYERIKTLNYNIADAY